jgi:hypothetical protein
VLAPLCDADEVTFPPRLITVAAIRNLWRQRVQELHSAGWPPAQKARDLAYAANCPPLSFALDDTDHRPCNLYRVCPFCHGLRTSLLFENVLRAVRRQQPPPDLHVLVTQHHCDADALGEALDRLDGLEATLLPAGPGPRGMVSRTAVAPARDDRGRLLLRHAALVALPAGTLPAGPLAERGFRVKSDELSLARTAANLARYPAGLLYGPAGAAVGVLDAVAGRHLGGAKGIFRSSRSVSSVLQIRDQRPAPCRRPPLPPYHLAEEEVLVSNIAPGHFGHERWAVRTLLAALDLPADADTFAAADRLPVPVSWLGRMTVSVEDFFRHPRRLDQLLKPHRRPGDHAVAYFSPGRGFMAFTTPVPSEAELADGDCVAYGTFGRRAYALETLAQFARRLRGRGRRHVGPGLTAVAG